MIFLSLMAQRLLIFGASARAAAFSALRAGLDPWCVDLFADADLEDRCSVLRLPAADYPEGFADVSVLAPPGPWMYTGGLENRSRLVKQIARLRQLWGMDSCLDAIRAPELVALALERQGAPSPRVRMKPPDATERWLVKPLGGAGGTGIRAWDGGEPPSRVYFQEFIAGDSCATLYLADDRGVALLGATHQLVGVDWLHAAPFHYCGSIGPLLPDAAVRAALERLGAGLYANFELRGLFGVDCVLRDGVPYPVEVNPRYTASVEVHEHVTGSPVLALHRAVFDKSAPAPVLYTGGKHEAVGKAIFFARQSLVFPTDGPWMTTLRQPGDVWDLPAFADIPHAGTPIKAGRPVLTFFARAGSVAACMAALRATAADLDRSLFGETDRPPASVEA
ncbi:MAG: ATP-grasp domain-containing protein [Gemmataceae bacterium]|nr:ATP-grasp domain-containing protein [Gemmataceae bacterium]